MIFKKSSDFFHFSAITVLVFGISCGAGKIGLDGRISKIYTNEAAKFLEIMDLSVDPCTDFYNFTCGGYMKRTTKLDKVSPGYDLYNKILDEIKDILESERDIPGSDISVARNIYKNCVNIVPDKRIERELVDSIASKVGLIKGKYETNSGKVYYKWNDTFDWIDGIHKLREMGLNFRFLLGFYVTPRSESDKRNILEIRKPVLDNDDSKIEFSKDEENLEIVNAGEFIDTLNRSFPLLKLIKGVLPKDANFSLQDEIRVDKAYINLLEEALRNVSASYWVESLHKKISSEINRLLPEKDSNDAEIGCLRKAIYYDYTFQVAISKMFLTDKKKAFVTEVINNVMKIAKQLINDSESFDEESRIKSIKKLSAMQLMIGYGDNAIDLPVLDWNDVDYRKYAENIFKLSKYQMDAKFRQLNLVKDVREWEIYMTPSTYNAAYYPKSTSLYMTALYLITHMHNINLPSYIHYGLFGSIMGHELGHTIDDSTNYDTLFEKSKNYDLAGSNVRENKRCLREAFYNLTEKYKESEADDFADLVGYKIAYYSYLESVKQNGYDNLLPGLNYNPQQMFWITSASVWCDKKAYMMRKDNKHSPSYARVLLPLSNLPEFGRDFNCPIGSPMNPESKCDFL